MSDDCEHDKARITIDGEFGPERVCILCEDIDFETIDEYQ